MYKTQANDSKLLTFLFQHLFCFHSDRYCFLNVCKCLLSNYHSRSNNNGIVKLFLHRYMENSSLGKDLDDLKTTQKRFLTACHITVKGLKHLPGKSKLMKKHFAKHYSRPISLVLSLFPLCPSLSHAPPWWALRHRSALPCIWVEVLISLLSAPLIEWADQTSRKDEGVRWAQ